MFSVKRIPLEKWFGALWLRKTPAKQLEEKPGMCRLRHFSFFLGCLNPKDVGNEQDLGFRHRVTFLANEVPALP